METRILDENHIGQMLPLLHELNPQITIDELRELQLAMFNMNNYTCFGLFDKGIMIGVASGWVTVRLYSGKQLEVDNVIISSNQQSKGLGKIFVRDMEEWAIKNGCKTIELNTYVANERSHKFYFNRGFKILGFHFQKQLEE